VNHIINKPATIADRSQRLRSLQARLAALFAGGFLLLCAIGMLTPSTGPHPGAQRATAALGHHRLAATTLAARRRFSGDRADQSRYRISPLPAVNPARHLAMRFPPAG
jgi:hypothetical protein